MNYKTARYDRQLQLHGFGSEAQEKLSKARVLVIGAGGLGCPVLEYLAAAGVGTIGIADNDLVSYSNLNRQVLYGQDDIGKNKALQAKVKLEALNNEIKILAYPEYWDPQLAASHFPGYDIIVDATDNFASRYLINDACVLFNKPLVFGAVSGFEGQVAVLNAAGNEPPVNYRDLFPVPPKNNEVRSCAEAGVLGVVPGLIGVLQATEVIKLITGIGKPLLNRMLFYNALTQEQFCVELSKNPESKKQLPDSLDTFLKLDYPRLCEPEAVPEISAAEWKEQIHSFLLVDVRQPDELPRITAFSHLAIPLPELENRISELEGRNIVFICQSGVRSSTAVSWLRNYPGKLYSLKGGIQALLQETN